MEGKRYNYKLDGIVLIHVYVFGMFYQRHVTYMFSGKYMGNWRKGFLYEILKEDFQIPIF